MTGPCAAADDPAAPVREVMRLAMWSVAAERNTGGDGPFSADALESLYSKSFATLYAAARRKIPGAQPPFDRDPISDGPAECPLKDVILTVLSPGAFHARVRAEFKTAWCIDPGQDPARRDRVTMTTFEMANEDEEWRVDDIRRGDWSFRDLLKAAVPDPGQEPPSNQTAADPQKCIKENSGFKQTGKAATFEIALANSCAQRFRCTISAYVTTAGGPTQGRSVLVLAPKSRSGATKTYVMKVKSAGGMANVSRECKPL